MDVKERVEVVNRPGLVPTFFLGKDGQIMPAKYDEATKAKAVRLVVDHRDDYDSEWAAMKAVAARLGNLGLPNPLAQGFIAEHRARFGVSRALEP